MYDIDFVVNIYHINVSQSAIGIINSADFLLVDVDEYIDEAVCCCCRSHM